MKKVFKIMLGIYNAWTEDKVNTMAASLAFYTVFSLVPLLIICIAIVGFFLGHSETKTYILTEFNHLMGYETSKQIEEMLISHSEPFISTISAAIGIIILFFGASGIFIELQNGLNSIWKVKTPKHGGIFLFIKQRILSFTMVLVIGFLLLVSLLISSALTVLGTYINSVLSFAGESINFIISVGMITILFAMIFKYLPDTPVKWSEVRLGALISALLFTVGKNILAAYFAFTHLSTTFGKASSLIVLLLWVYYSAQIVFFGAEITKITSMTKKKH